MYFNDNNDLTQFNCNGGYHLFSVVLNFLKLNLFKF